MTKIQRFLLRVAAWALRGYLSREPSPPEKQRHPGALLVPPRLESDRNDTQT